MTDSLILSLTFRSPRGATAFRARALEVEQRLEEALQRAAAGELDSDEWGSR
jgi:hypothetical protein